MVPSLPLLSCELSVSMKENPDRKKKICEFGSFKNPFTMTTSLYELYFKNQKIYPFGTNEKGDFYELWQQHKQLKIIGMSEA